MPDDKKKADKQTKTEEKEPPEDYSPFFDFDPLGYAFDALSDLVTGKIFEGPTKTVKEITNDEPSKPEPKQPQAAPVTINNIFRAPSSKRSGKSAVGAGGAPNPKEKRVAEGKAEPAEGDKAGAERGEE